MALYPLFKPLLFALAPETAHGLVTGVLRVGGRLPGFRAALNTAYHWEHPALRVRLWEREFSNPVGLAAGFDKDGLILGPLLGLGFGFVESGTVTPRPQPGNPRPRLFRLPEDRGLINRMGFNNAGAEALAVRLRRFQTARGERPVGVNLGKNRETPLAAAEADYLAALGPVVGLADYLVINVSSPNTPGLRDLQTRETLVGLVRALAGEWARLRALPNDPGEALARKPPPILIKVSPDLDEAGLREVAAAALEAPCDGLIATNTTLERPGLRNPHRDESGGLSGAPLHRRAVEVVAALHRFSEGKLPLIGVGGISSAEDAYRFIRAGASLVQLYSGLIYRGPGLVREIKKGLVACLERDGLVSIQEAVGADNEP